MNSGFDLFLFRHKKIKKKRLTDERDRKISNT